MSVTPGVRETSVQGVEEAPSTTRLSQELSPRAMEVIKSLDSRSFGFLDFQRASNEPSSATTADNSGAASFLSPDFIRQGIDHLKQEASSCPQVESLKSEVYCQLGHLHLLLEEYSQALSAYEHYQRLCPESSSNGNLFYGLGLIYFHFKAYDWATEAFQKVLFLCPYFARVNEIHLRLGIMCKMKGDYASSLTHFEKAQSVSGPASLTKLEVQFHKGHTHHLQGLYSNAKRAYEGILAAKSVPSRIRAMTLRQLGWLYHTIPAISNPSADAHNKAIELLKLAVGADPSSGRTWYFLGRCHAAQGRAHEAFMAYQQAVNKQEEDQANVWCSIGVLYHNMSQPRDSLQSYLCAVYLDPTQPSAWVDMGCLYESIAQPVDALLCYKNALCATQRKKCKDYLLSRVASLEQYLNFANPSLFAQSGSLPNLHEAWYSLIPKHIRSQRPHPETPLLKLPGLSYVPASPVLPSFSSLPPPHAGHSSRSLAKRQRSSRNRDPIIINDSRSWMASNHPFPLMPPPSVTPFHSTSGMGNGNGTMVATKAGYEHLSTLSMLHPSGMGLDNAGLCPVPRISPEDMGYPTNHMQVSSGPSTPLVGGIGLEERGGSGASLSSPDLPGHTPFPPTLGGTARTVEAELLGDAFSGSQGLSDLQRILSSPQGSQLRREGNRPSAKHKSGHFVSPVRSPTWARGPASCHSRRSTLTSPLPSDPPSDNLLSSVASSVWPGHVPSGWKVDSFPAVTSNTGVPGHPGSMTSGNTLSTGTYSIALLPRRPPRWSSSSSSPMDVFSPPSVMTFDPILSLGHTHQPSLPPITIDPHVTNDLPGDLSAVTPLDIGPTLPDDYVQQILDDAQGRQGGAESMRENGPARKRKHSSSSSSSSLGLNGVSRFGPRTEVGPEQRVSLQKRPRPLGNHVAGSPTHLQQPPTDIVRLPNDSVRSGDDVASARAVLEDPLGGTQIRVSTNLVRSSVNTDELPKASHPTSSPQAGPRPSVPGNKSHVRPTSFPGPLSVSMATTAELNSDTSSGFSSGSAKLSTTSSGNVSPFNSPSSSSAVSSLSPFSPEGPGGGAKHTRRRGFKDEGLQTPIYEPFPGLGNEDEYMVQDPEIEPPERPHPLCKETELKPDCPVFTVSTREEALSETIHAQCCNTDVPICMIRGLVEALELDLSLFSTKCLVETCTDHEMEVREQIQQAADENWDSDWQYQVWKCESTKSLTTIGEYASYQYSVEDKSTHSEGSDDGRGRQGKMLRFGTNVDLSDEDIWGTQLTELEKLPKFLQVSCSAGNLLTHVGHNILGMNSLQLYMKVTGSRTPGHQENNNFCSININIGEGDCEWFAVPNKYWGVMHQLCEKHKVNFLVGSWWPILDELYKLDVPVYRFTQYKGDLVWINPGTVHWVQANSVCNNIAWNTGPITAHQFRMSWERYRWNKVQEVRSIVPMIHLTWNLAKNVKIVDRSLYEQVRSLLESSLFQTKHLLSHLQRANIPVHWHGRMDGEPAPCCNTCMDEVFNILFVVSQRDQYLVYCHKCAGSMKRSFIVLQQYSTEELENTVSSLRLHSRPPRPNL